MMAEYPLVGSNAAVLFVSICAQVTMYVLTKRTCLLRDGAASIMSAAVGLFVSMNQWN